MRRKLWVRFSSVVLVALLGVHARAQTPSYQPGPAPTVGDIVTVCVQTLPAPQSRTDVGIGDQVTCSIDATTWQDIDYAYDGYGNQSNVYDYIGTVTWSQ